MADVKRAATLRGRVIKVSDESEAIPGGNPHGYVLGFAIVCKVDGADYYDLQDEHVPEDVCEAAAHDFMRESRAGNVMHGSERVGEIVESFVLTAAKAAALGLPAPKQTGWIIAFAPASAEVRKRFVDGELRGFSIGGAGYVTEEG